MELGIKNQIMEMDAEGIFLVLNNEHIPYLSIQNIILNYKKLFGVGNLSIITIKKPTSVSML